VIGVESLMDGYDHWDRFVILSGKSQIVLGRKC